MKLVLKIILFISIHILTTNVALAEIEDNTNTTINLRNGKSQCSWVTEKNESCEDVKPVGIILQQFSSVEYYSLLCNGVNIGDNTAVVPTECFEWYGKPIEDHFVTTGSDSWCINSLKHTIIAYENVERNGVNLTFLHGDPPILPTCDPFRYARDIAPTELIGFSGNNKKGYTVAFDVNCRPDIPTGGLYAHNGSFYGFQHPRCEYSNERGPIKISLYFEPPVPESESIEDPGMYDHQNSNCSMDVETYCEKMMRAEELIEDLGRNNHSLMEKTASLEKRVTDLEALVENLMAQLNNLGEIVANKQNKTDEITDDNKLNKYIENTTSEVNEIRSAIDDLKTELQKTEEKFTNKLKLNNENLMETIHNLTEVANATQAEALPQSYNTDALNTTSWYQELLQEIQKNISNIKKETNDSNNILEEIKSDYENNKSLLDEFMKDLGILYLLQNDTKSKLEDRIDKLDHKLEHTNYRNDVLFEDIIQTIYELKNETQKNDSTVDKLEEQADESVDKIEEIFDNAGNKSDKELDEKIQLIFNKLEKDGRELKNNLDKIRSDNEENKLKIEEEIKKLQIQNNQTKDYIEQILNNTENNNESSWNEKIIKDIKNAINKLEEETQHTKNNLSELRGENDENKSNILDILEDIKNLYTQENSTKSNLEQIVNDFGTKSKNTSHNNEQLIEEIRNTINSIEEETRETQTQLNGLQNDSEESKSEIQRILNDINELRSSENQTKNDVEEIRNNLATPSNWTDELLEEIKNAVDNIAKESINTRAQLDDLRNGSDENKSMIKDILSDIQNLYSQENQTKTDINQLLNDIESKLNNTSYPSIEELEDVKKHLNNIEEEAKNMNNQLMEVKTDTDENKSVMEKILNDIESLYLQGNQTKNYFGKILNDLLSASENASMDKEIIEDIKNSVINLEEDTKVTKTQLNEIRKENDEIKSNMQQINNDLINLYSEYNETKIKSDNESNKHNKELVSIRRIIVKVEEEAQKIEANIKDINEELKILYLQSNETKIEIEQTLSDMIVSSANTSLEISELIFDIHGIIKDVEDRTKDTKAQLNEIIHNTTETRLKLQQILGDINNLYSLSNETNNKLQQTLNDLSSSSGNTSARTEELIDDISNTIIKLEKDAEETKNQLNDTRNNCDKNTFDIEDLLKFLNSLYQNSNHTNKDIYSKLDYMTNHNSKLFEQIFQTIDAIENDLESHIIKELIKNITTIKEETENTRARFDRLQNDTDENQSKMHKIAEDLHELYGQNNRTESRIEQNINDLKEMKNEFAGYKSKMDNMEKDIANLNSQNTQSGKENEANVRANKVPRNIDIIKERTIDLEPAKTGSNNSSNYTIDTESFNSMKKNFADFANQYDFENELLSLKENITNLDSKFEKLENHTAHFFTNISEIEKRLANFNEDNTNTKTSIKGVLKIVENLKSFENYNIGNNTDRMQSQIDFLKHIIKENQYHIETRLNDTNEILHDMKTRNLKSQIDNLENEIKALKYCNEKFRKKLINEQELIVLDAKDIQNKAIKHIIQEVNSNFYSMHQSFKDIRTYTEVQYLILEKSHQIINENITRFDQRLNSTIGNCQTPGRNKINSTISNGNTTFIDKILSLFRTRERI